MEASPGPLAQGLAAAASKPLSALHVFCPMLHMPDPIAGWPLIQHELVHTKFPDF